MNSPSLNLPWSEQYRIRGLEWADADAAASILEDTKSAVLSEMLLQHADKPVNRAEALVKASPAWRDHIGKMVAARQKANRLKVETEFLKMKFNEWQSHEATKRTEARL